MPTTTQPAARRVIAPAAPTQKSWLPAGWFRALVAGLEAATLSWLTVVVPAIATYVATAAAPALGEASWMTAARTGTSVWLLGHGGALAAAGSITLVPLGLTLVCVLLAYGSTRRMHVDSYVLGGFSVVGYALTVTLLGLVAPNERWGAVVGASAVAALGVLPAVRRNGAVEPSWWGRRRRRAPGYVGAGLAASGWAMGALAVAALGVTGVALVQGMPRVRELHEGLVGDPVSTVVLVLAQLAYLPTAAVWALSWLAGPGFVVGTGTAFSPFLVTTAPMPAVPVLGALPAPGEPGQGWVMALPILVGAGAGLYLHRRRRAPTVDESVLAAVLMAASVSLMTAALVWAASGAIGPQRMSEVGAAAPTVAAVVFAEVGLGALVVVLVLHPNTHERLRALWGRGAAPG